ncbi:MAG TPA: flagellar hook-length control protein FliK [Candidatus Gastranaerophilales bacterium]|nr:flagellar hook-length control protein FliK [Candidatus Gastranaerophilales bacterium]
MTLNILMDLIKTDFNLKQTDINSNYSTKDTSDKFMKVFETANKSYNFNNEKMESFVVQNSDENFFKKLSSNNDKEYNYQDTSSFSFNQTAYNPENKASLPPKEDLVVEDKISATTEKPEPVIHKDKSDFQNTATAHEQTISKDNVQNKTDKPELKETITANKQQAQEKAENINLIKTESIKDTTGKILLEKADATGKEIKIAGKNQDLNLEAKKEEQKDIKLLQNHNEKDNIPDKKAVLKSENIDQKAKIQQDIQNALGLKAKNIENADNLIKKETVNEEQPELQQLTNNKTKTNKPKEEIKSLLPPPAKGIEVKEDLKIENIKIVSNTEDIKIAKDLMNKQGEQNLEQGTKGNTNINQVGASENGAQKIDLQKTAQFEKILDSKQADSTQKSVLNQVKEATAQLGNNKSQVSISLRPDNLGKININLISNKGEVTAQITAENNQVKDMLDKGLETLKQNLSEQGVNVTKVVINVQQESSTNKEKDFDQENKFGYEGDSSETNAKSNREDNLATNNLNSAEGESYDFEEENEEAETIKQPGLIGNVDYKV